ncbi:hypothetical protein BD410DRAFT_778335 [Rickenella mellea]|uniref:SGNH hydrolase-type esterase domain-containing protein n=1 Tax=Rickenella mellea TaxID=50990 RepID=A0A4Y7PL35_9AGAM|nr:hypothetical protein BD410DRAFT_778335 [Rickenella mellea]
MFTDWYAVRKHWHGYGALKHLVIFGASYCDVGYTPASPHPSKDRPLGVDFPGRTYSEPGTPNWVGHFVRDLSPNPAEPLLAYTYAVGGHDVSGVVRQVEELFVPDVGRKPEWAPWKASDTLFITCIGLSDCARAAFAQSTHEETVMRLMASQARLYEIGARNFLIIDAPPMHRLEISPFGPDLAPTLASSFHTWNTHLHASLHKFSSTHPSATTLLFSSWAFWNSVYDNPETFGFTPADVQERGGKVWLSNLLITSRMHAVFAEEMVGFLNNVPAFEGDPKKKHLNTSPGAS